jgi:hypothetical protein
MRRLPLHCPKVRVVYLGRARRFVRKTCGVFDVHLHGALNSAARGAEVEELSIHCLLLHYSACHATASFFP